MTEKLIIQNFGPIKSAEITIRPLTIFIGPQASGKSLTALSLYFLRRFDRLILPHYSNQPIKGLTLALERWFGKQYELYIHEDTQLQWLPDITTPENVHALGWHNHQLTHLSELLVQRLKQPSSSTDTPIATDAEVYIPAGRTLYSFLPPATTLNPIIEVEDWPGYVRKFYEILGSSIRWLLHENRNSVGKPDIDFLQSRIDLVLKGSIHYDFDTIKLTVNEQTLPAKNIASGQMEIWPFWAIIEAGLRSNRLTPAQLYFEEPEAHLHPQAQRLIMEMIAYLVQGGTHFLLTTHSPYLLYAVNNFLLAHQVLAAGQALPPNFPAEVALSPDQVAAYRFAADGTVHDLMDSELGLIDAAELDQIADDLGATFADLQDCLEGVA